MERRSSEIAKLKARAAKAGIAGNREYNNGWHTALDLDNLLTVSEIVARAAIERKESRGAHFRDDFPDKERRLGEVQPARHEGARTEVQSASAVPDEADARRAETSDRGENK